MIDIARATDEQGERLNRGKQDFDKMMETIKPFLKEKQPRYHNSEMEWSHCEI
jgi:hypothetical protein